jgi:hypothetical protein
MWIPSRDQFPLGLPAPAVVPAVSTFPLPAAALPTAALPAADMTSASSPVIWPAAQPTRERFNVPHDYRVAEKPGAGANRIGALLAPEDGEIALNEYRVTVGHVSVAVECSSSAEAVRLARTRLCVELPRLWDVIRTMDASRFKVIVVK